jgi:hypothetical protein
MARTPPLPPRTRSRIEPGVAEMTGPGVDPVPATLNALLQTAQALNATAAQLLQAVQARGPDPGAAGRPPFVTSQINTWEDDPFSQSAPTSDPTLAAPIAIGAPGTASSSLPFAIAETAGVANQFALGTPEFRYWTAAGALGRSIEYWASILPSGTRWSTMNSVLQVRLVAGRDLNAFYSRRDGLRFFQDTIRTIDIFSGESPDVVCHELGHAILDALRPQLFNVASLEAAAFHEAFGDVSSILSALQLAPFRAAVLEDTGGRLNVSSRLSRVAEQLGWGIRQIAPTAVDRDCLRNAANRFFYQAPEDLAPTAPAGELASESHSFARVFTGGFLDALAYMVDLAGSANDATLLAVSRDIGQLLVDAIRTASITPAYYSQVGAAMVQADKVRNNGKYRDALTEAFVKRGILSPTAAVGLANAPLPHLEPAPSKAAGISEGQPMAARIGLGPNAGGMVLSYNGANDDSHLRGYDDAPELPSRSVIAEFMAGTPILMHLPEEKQRLAAASAALDQGSAEPSSAERAGRCFLEDLIRLGRIDLGDVVGVAAALRAPVGAKTHVLESTPSGQVLKRIYFDCGMASCR